MLWSEELHEMNSVPLLINAFINDIRDSIHNSIYFLFADYLPIYHIINNIKDLYASAIRY
jgi:hypothetical protein